MSIHFVLQGKGGVGKSLIAVLLAQYLQEKNDHLFCADTDPVNDTFSRYKSLPVQRLNVLNQSMEIDSRVFDCLIESLMNQTCPAVIDNGASTFIPLSAYLAENGVIDMLNEMGKTVYIHTVLTGGQAMDDTMNGLVALLRNQPAQIVVWENEYFGDVSKNGKRFIDTNIYEHNKNRIKGIINIKQRNKSTFGKDIELMVSNKLTFNDAPASGLFTAMPLQRLATVRRDIFEQLETAGL
ncbi:nucleotide-binding protein [Iodobacter fluviatilis]|uniref:Conjugal transfer protein TraL n=1 Tax=Iodobacter fluviatilis TaxID=537 RepID=A0A7G3GB78_9NEIS|nr:conjugal transfer protein TraL [Iodobacter fluviatilis]QBC44428.1 conjugal transfer protein TraL [Iodobacter fluviatilis]